MQQSWHLDSRSEELKLRIRCLREKVQQQDTPLQKTNAMALRTRRALLIAKSCYLVRRRTITNEHVCQSQGQHANITPKHNSGSMDTHARINPKHLKPKILKASLETGAASMTWAITRKLCARFPTKDPYPRKRCLQADCP